MIVAVAYGLGALAFAGLLVLILMGRRAKGVGRNFVAACAVTLLWLCAAAISNWGVLGAVQPLESARAAAWLYFLASVLGTAADARGNRTILRIAPLALGAIAILNDLRFAGAESITDFDFTQIVARLAMAIAGMLLVENLYRNAGSEQRWHVVPLCIALGGMFAYDLFLYSDALLFHRVDITLLAARGAIMALIVPPLVLTLVRNQDWRIDVHVSRQFVFHTATLLTSGAFLLSAAAVALVLRRFPGDWGTLFQAVFLTGSVLVLFTVLSSGSIQSRLRGLLVRNLFSHRYDYRTEWMAFVDTVSGTDHADSLQLRVIRAIANLMDSPGGVLWLRSGTGDYSPHHDWNMHFDRQPQEPEGSAFIASFEGGERVQELAAGTGDTPSKALPSWAQDQARVWLAVPLQHQTGLLGFITLSLPRAPAALDWESRDLLLAVGRQAASYLSEEQVARDLVDAKLLTEYSRRFAFVVHDIKNLVSQLTLTVANARKHGSDPEFREDMLRTLENSVARMRELLLKLSPEKTPGKEPAIADANEVIAEVVKEIGAERVLVVREDSERKAPVAIRASALRSTLTHLVTNALEASERNGRVTIRSREDGARFVIEVQDEGPGMDETFIREELFRPFRSTKSKGYGIGAFQSRETIREAGGDLLAISAVGRGTTMRIVLPYLGENRAADRVGAVGT